MRRLCYWRFFALSDILTISPRELALSAFHRFPSASQFLFFARRYEPMKTDKRESDYFQVDLNCLTHSLSAPPNGVSSMRSILFRCMVIAPRSRNSVACSPFAEIVVFSARAD